MDNTALNICSMAEVVWVRNMEHLVIEKKKRFNPLCPSSIWYIKCCFEIPSKEKWLFVTPPDSFHLGSCDLKISPANKTCRSYIVYVSVSHIYTVKTHSKIFHFYWKFQKIFSLLNCHRFFLSHAFWGKTDISLQGCTTLFPSFYSTTTPLVLFLFSHFLSFSFSHFE